MATTVENGLSEIVYESLWTEAERAAFLWFAEKWHLPPREAAYLLLKGALAIPDVMIKNLARTANYSLSEDISIGCACDHIAAARPEYQKHLRRIRRLRKLKGSTSV